MKPGPVRLAATATLGAALACLAGCSGDEEPPKPATTATVDPVDPADLAKVPTIDGVRGALDALAWDAADCPTQAGPQATTGSLRNETRKTHDYVVLVTWIGADGEVLARGRAIEPAVRPGRSAQWRVEVDVPDGARSCVANVLRGRVRA